MKYYYQRKGDGFLLNHNIYKKTRNEISCYKFLNNLCEEITSKSPLKITKNDIHNKIVAEKYITVIENALKKYVPEEYQKAVWEHTVDGVEYEELECKYYYSTSTMKKWTQHFVWGVANLLGEDFTK